MKILIVIAHYYKPQENAIHSSTDASLRAVRQKALEDAVLSWRAHYSQPATINIERKKFVLSETSIKQMDIAVLVSGEDHLLTKEFTSRYQTQTVQVKTDHPKLLPFAAHKLMADNRYRYDWFIYSEDDLAIPDGSFLKKQVLFQQLFGERRLLQPNRFEVNPGGVRYKTYIDGDLRKGFIEPYLAMVNDDRSLLRQETSFGAVEFARSRNPHAGFFAITDQQLCCWVNQKHFMDMDCSFVSPLESAATLGMLKTFAIYKSIAPNQDYCEIEHLDRKFSGLRLGIE
jgi:hypothetical protein